MLASSDPIYANILGSSADDGTIIRAESLLEAQFRLNGIRAWAEDQ